MNNRLNPNTAYIATPFDAHDRHGLPPLNELKAAWDKPLPHEDPLMDEERRLLCVAQCVRDFIGPGRVIARMNTKIVKEDMGKEP